MIDAAELHAFFDDFVVAFAGFDGALVAQRYAAPYMAIGADGTTRVFENSAQIAAYFQQVLDDYRRQGCHACHYQRLEFMSLGTSSCVASVSWELLNEQGQVLSGWRESYNLVRLAEGLRIRVSTDHA